MLAVRITGHVTEPHTSTPAAHALVTASLATPDCDPLDQEVQVFADAHGNYDVTLEGGVGPDLVTCVVVTATLGGATGSAEIESVRLRTTSSTVPPETARADITLAPVPPLTRAEGEALLDRFAEVLNGGHTYEPELSVYVWDGPEALRAALEDYGKLLGDHVRASVTGSNFRESDQRVEGVLTGSRRSLSLGVYQDRYRVRRLISPLIHYSHRSRLFMASFSRLVAAGEAAPLARLLTADDVDYPVEQAERVIAKYRPPFESAGGSYELVDLDEERSTLTYRLTWFAPDQESVQAVVRLGYGDGLLWLRDEDVAMR